MEPGRWTLDAGHNRDGNTSPAPARPPSSILHPPSSTPPRRRHRARLAAAAFALLAVTLFTSARCYPSGSRVVIFVQGIYTTYDATGTESTVLEGHRFNVLKNAFIAKGYDRSALLDYSYNGGAVTSAGVWQPQPYTCTDTDRRAAENLDRLEQMIRDYRRRHRDAHVTLVGHSLGGYLVFLEGAREAERSSADKLGIDVVVTLDAPLKGVSADKKAIIDLIPCDKTYLAGAEIVADKLNPDIAGVRQTQAAAIARAGIRLATLGNVWDCLWNTQHCLPGSTFVDDSDTQFLPGQAAISNAYTVDSPALLSHDAILADAGVARDTAAFVGAP